MVKQMSQAAGQVISCNYNYNYEVTQMNLKLEQRLKRDANNDLHCFSL